MKSSVNISLAHRQDMCNLPCGYSTILPHKGVHCSNWFLIDDHMCLTFSLNVRCTHTSMAKITTPSETCSTWHTLSPIHILQSAGNVGSTNNFCLQKLDYCALSLFGESMARSLTVISLLFQSTTHCRYRVYSKFLLTYTAIYQRNLIVLPQGVTALQPQSHFHLGKPYIHMYVRMYLCIYVCVFVCVYIFFYVCMIICVYVSIMYYVCMFVYKCMCALCVRIYVFCMCMRVVKEMCV